MTGEPTLEAVQHAGFVVGGEPLVALDLADTVMLATTPPTDLLDSPERFAAWWELQAPRLPAGPRPDLPAIRRLRAAVRDLLDARLEHRAPDATSVSDLNATIAAAPTSLHLVETADGADVRTRWHTEHGGNAALAAIAREAVELMAAPDRLAGLRRCANPGCSMLFLAENRRRRWCTANICGNRARVARHYHRTRSGPVSPA